MRRTIRSEARHPERHRAPSLLLTCAAASVGLLAWMLTPATAEARTITADRTSERDLIGGTSGCTLREAIKAMNTRANVNGCLAGDGSNDTIKLLPASTYLVHLAASTDTMTFTRGMTIYGAGVESTVIKPDTAGNFNMFVVATSATVTIQGVTMRDVTNAHVLVVNAGASGRVFLCWIINSGSSSAATLGAMQNRGALSLFSVEFSGNHGWGSGALFNSATMYVQDSSFVDNDGARAGAFLNEGSSASATFVNSTFGRNTGGNQATAVRNGLNGTVDLRGCTILNNRSFGSSVIGAVHNETGTIKIKNTFISNNTNGAGSKPNCAGAITSQGNNYLGDSDFTACVPVVRQDTDVSGGFPDMAQDANGFPIRRGGITRVYVPGSFSVGLAKIPESDCFPTDQRGLGRRDGSNCEIGAVNRAHATLIVGNAANPANEDLQMATWLQTLGFDIYYHDDDWAAFDDFNIGLTIAIISTTVSDATVGTKYRDHAMGFVINKISALDNMKMVATNAYGTFNTTQHIYLPGTADFVHLAIGNAAATDINLGGGGWGTPSGTAWKTYANYNFNGKPAIFRVTPGSAVDGGFILRGGRISFPGWPSFFTGSGTNDGKNLFYEAVFWASRNRK